jgi:CRP/FNR family transcriptional regulator
MSAHDAAALLRASAMFAGLPAKEIAALAAVAQEHAQRAREYVFMEDDPAQWLYIVKSGRVKILRHSRTGRDVVLELLGPGEVFGAVAVVERRPYPASAQAVAASAVLRIPAETILALSERQPSLIREMALMIGRRLRAAHESVKSLSVDPVEARLAARLLRLAENGATRGPRGLTLPFHLTRQSLADMTGTTVETAIRVVSRWLKDGLLLDEDGRLVLTDVAALRALAEGEREED